MLKSFLKNLTWTDSERHSIPQGRRVYAVGDIHGRLDLLNQLLEQIDEDDRSRPHADTEWVFLGDLVDRGSDSAGVVERLIEFSAERRRVRFLLGNHEEIFLSAIEGETKAVRALTRMGGEQTILSYGISGADYLRCDYEELSVLLRAAVPEHHVTFLKSFENQVEIGDYLFVHAGIRPGQPLETQRVSDLRWIREDFLSSRLKHGKMVVHGHTISEDVDIRSNRIGIDTGAFQSGRLTAIGLEGDERWFITAEGPPSAG